MGLTIMALNEASILLNDTFSTDSNMVDWEMFV
jgi:hypothetical protein